MYRDRLGRRRARLADLPEGRPTRPEEIAEIRANYAALVTACDHYFGQLLDYFDEHDLWKDTALVLSTDHGFLLAEHDWWGKNLMPYYTEISHIPLIVHHPDCASMAGQAPHLADADDGPDADVPRPLRAAGAAGSARALGRCRCWNARRPQRDVGIFGMFGGPIGATDGRYTYYLYPDDLYAPGLHEYTLMPMHLHSLFSVAEMKTIAHSSRRSTSPRACRSCASTR